MEWVVEFTDEFQAWFDSLTEEAQDDIAAKVEVLGKRGPMLGRPHVDTIRNSKHPNMKELIVQHEGDPYRVFFAFDPRRCAILLIGGEKTGYARFYERMVPVADRLYDAHLAELKREGVIRDD
jgi:hypothetical protein